MSIIDFPYINLHVFPKPVQLGQSLVDGDVEFFLLLVSLIKTLVQTYYEACSWSFISPVCICLHNILIVWSLLIARCRLMSTIWYVGKRWHPSVHDTFLLIPGNLGTLGWLLQKDWDNLDNVAWFEIYIVTKVHLLCCIVKSRPQYICLLLMNVKRCLKFSDTSSHGWICPSGTNWWFGWPLLSASPLINRCS